MHSWKDLPIEGRTGTVVAGTLERADVRDVLLVREDVVTSKPARLDILTSSPRRAWQLASSLRPLLPWTVSDTHTREVRGNVPTRLKTLVNGDAHGLVVAKAALDRLLAPDTSTDARDDVRAALDRCRWMVLPLRDFPAAPAQGALAIEVASTRPYVIDLVRAISHEPTRIACEQERAILTLHGGGCHEAIGASVLIRDYGVITSVRGRGPSGETVERWTLERSDPAAPARAPMTHIWPRPDELGKAIRRPLVASIDTHERGLWVTRAEALPGSLGPDPARVVWAAGIRTWAKLATRGVWVHGCADGLGDGEAPDVDLLGGNAIRWQRLTHTRSGAPDATATYEVVRTLPADLASRTHFFWTSGSFFLEALERFPGIREGWHASGPGRTSRVIRDTLGDSDRVSIWLDYHQWQQNILL